MTRDLGNKLIALALALMIAYVVGTGVVAYRSTRTIAAYEGQVARSQEVIAQVQGALVALDDAETGQRGFLLLNDPTYLAPYNAALNVFAVRLARLGQLVAADPDQRARQARMATLADAKIDELRRTVALQQAGQADGALAVVRSGVGKDVMDDIRATVAAMVAAEELALDQRALSAAQARQTAEVTLIVATTVEVALLGGLIALLWQMLRQRERVSAERAALLAQEREARGEAEAAVRLRDEFLGIASHELKNPLTALQGNAQLLQRRLGRREDLDERDRRMIGLLGAQTQRLWRLIDTMLDVSRLDSGRLTIERTPLDCGELIRRVVAEVGVVQEEGRLTASTPDAPLIVEGDELRLEQVIQNLLQNALRYSPSGSAVRVEVGQEGERARIAVSDRGSGISAEALPHLFERYYRAPNTSGQRPGLGIGLFVVREIVALHGGEITVDSTEGRGSTFTVWLPLAVAY